MSKDQRDDNVHLQFSDDVLVILLRDEQTGPLWVPEGSDGDGHDALVRLQDLKNVLWRVCRCGECSIKRQKFNDELTMGGVDLLMQTWVNKLLYVGEPSVEEDQDSRQAGAGAESSSVSNEDAGSTYPQVETSDAAFSTPQKGSQGELSSQFKTPTGPKVSTQIPTPPPTVSPSSGAAGLFRAHGANASTNKTTQEVQGNDSALPAVAAEMTSELPTPPKSPQGDKPAPSAVTTAALSPLPKVPSGAVTNFKRPEKRPEATPEPVYVRTPSEEPPAKRQRLKLSTATGADGLSDDEIVLTGGTYAKKMAYAQEMRIKLREQRERQKAAVAAGAQSTLSGLPAPTTEASSSSTSTASVRLEPAAAVALGARDKGKRVPGPFKASSSVLPIQRGDVDQVSYSNAAIPAGPSTMAQSSSAGASGKKRRLPGSQVMPDESNKRPRLNLEGQVRAPFNEPRHPGPSRYMTQAEKRQRVVEVEAELQKYRQEIQKRLKRMEKNAKAANRF